MFYYAILLLFLAHKFNPVLCCLQHTQSLYYLNWLPTFFLFFLLSCSFSSAIRMVPELDLAWRMTWCRIDGLAKLFLNTLSVWFEMVEYNILHHDEICCHFTLTIRHLWWWTKYNAATFDIYTFWFFFRSPVYFIRAASISLWRHESSLEAPHVRYSRIIVVCSFPVLLRYNIQNSPLQQAARQNLNCDYSN